MTTESSPRIFLLGAAVMALLVGLTLVARSLAVAWGLGPTDRILLAGVLPAFFAIAATVALEKSLSGKEPVECLVALGLGRPHIGQLKVSAVCLLPIAVAYLVMFSVFGVSSARQPNLPWLILKFLVSQGIGEETVFRGFVFRHLRPGRSFLRAATLSAIAFSVVHLAGLLRGFSADNLFDVAVSLSFSFLMAYAMALLFESGGGTIWGCALLHLGIDSINWFSYSAEARFGPGNIVYMVGIVAAVGMVFLVVPRKLSEPQRTW